MHTRVLPDEAAHSQYEMRSFVRSDSGVLYPTGQGRLAEASNPVSSNTVAKVTTPVSVTGNVPGTLPKPALPKPAKEKPRSKPSTAKGSRTGAGYSVPTVAATYQEEIPASTNLNTDQLTVTTPKEDYRARQSRLNAYDDAIESVLRRVQETDDDIYEQIASDFGNEEEPLVPPIVAAGRSLDRDEREAQIADTIDAVIARSFNESDHSLSPPPAPVGSPPPYDEEDEIIEVHSVSPLKVEVTTDDILILPPPSPPATSPVPVRTLAERKFVPEEERVKPTPRRSKKPRNKQPVSVVDKEVNNDFRWSSDAAKPASPDVPSRLKFGIPESYVKLEEMSSIGKGREMPDEEDDFNQPLPMDAAESLMKLAGVAPPPKRLRISYGSGRERTIEDTRDGGEGYEVETTSTSKPDLGFSDLSHRDHEEGVRRSTSSELLALEQGQRSARDERARSRSRELIQDAVEVHDVLPTVTEPSKPAGRKGRPRKETKKRGRSKKAAVPVIALYLYYNFCVFICCSYLLILFG